MDLIVQYAGDSSGTDIAETLDSCYYKGQGERESIEREFVIMKVVESKGEDDIL